MGRTRWIISNVNVVNIVLAAVLVVFANNMFLPLFGKGAKITIPSPKKQAAVPAKTTEKPADSKSPSPSDYFLIAEQNLFHPERKIPPEKKDIADKPLPKPEFVLYGTLVQDDFSIAYMEDRKAPQSSPSRGKKQIPLRLGQSLSGFILREIDADKVVMVRGDEQLEVQLNDPSKSKTRESSTGVPIAQQAPPPIQPAQPVTAGQQHPAQPVQAATQQRQPARAALRQPPAPIAQPPASAPPAGPSPADIFQQLFKRR